MANNKPHNVGTYGIATEEKVVEELRTYPPDQREAVLRSWLAYASVKERDSRLEADVKRILQATNAAGA